MSTTELNKLSRGVITGKNLLSALKHLETCESCRKKYPLPSIEELIAKISDKNSRAASKENTINLAAKAEPQLSPEKTKSSKNKKHDDHQTTADLNSTNLDQQQDQRFTEFLENYKNRNDD